MCSNWGTGEFMIISLTDVNRTLFNVCSTTDGQSALYGPTRSSAIAERPRDCDSPWKLEMQLRGHSRSLKIVPFESLCAVSYSHWRVFSRFDTITRTWQSPSHSATAWQKEPPICRLPRLQSHDNNCQEDKTNWMKSELCKCTHQMAAEVQASNKALSVRVFVRGPDTSSRSLA